MKSSNFPTKRESTSVALVLLFRLIEAKNWGKLTRLFLSNPEGRKSFQYLARLVAKSSSFNGLTILHVCARFDPPADLIRGMVELCPHAISTQDCLARTPLHIAAGCRASTAVMKVLVEFYPEACLIHDKDGRTPLHMACDSSCELFEQNSNLIYQGEIERPPPSYRTIDVLLSAKLHSAVLEDEDGMSAIEYALCSNADMMTVQLIQNAAHKWHTKGEMDGAKFSQKDSSPPAKGFSPRALLTARLA